MGHHSTSDDSTAYRSLEEIQKWTTDENAVQKLRLYLERKGLNINIIVFYVRNSDKTEIGSLCL